ncbi:guanyl-specific ribonuclease Sa [Thioalkalivibrio nitratireducens DSM 14787]|uniref:Guanyl-specific ribonuclease Sa n=1 Tax=Thioalkalivibrio nitratireducens (strain DSM 14787 / UNIQEM 213 / ALEN2) TaxID=1255043 RepID=L0DZH0_THIND|nr:ribonuclease domain-containing protein [Thioalkalivibrio nitratireducens]AGA34438.1 guanyl-specific ribonuclease Sa [Thioalkalivibrio nitratireducens DSM 14787]
MSNKPLLLTLLILAVAFAALQFGPNSWLGPDPAPSPVEELAPAGDHGLVVPNVEVRDLDGRVAWQGDVDLAPALERIAAGESDPHRNDGGVFHNREGLLPARPSGHYREYVIRTPGISHAGPQRLVIGEDGEVYYTHDHYRSFRRIR